MQLPTGGSGVIDNFALCILFGEEDGFMVCDLFGEFAIFESCVHDTFFVELNEIVPMTSEAFAAKLSLQAEDVNGSCLFPEGPFRAHDADGAFRKNEILEKWRGIRCNGAHLEGFACRARSEIDLDPGSNVARTGREWPI